MNSHSHTCESCGKSEPCEVPAEICFHPPTILCENCKSLGSLSLNAAILKTEKLGVQPTPATKIPVRTTLNPSDCRICRKKLSDGEFTLSRSWHFDCEVCQLCNTHFPNPTRILECLDGQIPVSHITCFYKHQIEKLRTHTIPITRDMVKAFNAQILDFRHVIEPPETDVGLLGEMVAELTEAAHLASWMLGQVKEKITISSSIEYEQKQRTKKKIESALSAEENEKAVQLKAEREDKTGMLRAERKAIEQAAALWKISFQDAKKAIEEQKAKFQRPN